MTKETLLELLKAEALPIDETLLWEKLNRLKEETSKNKTVTAAQKLLKYNLETMLELKNKPLEITETELVDDATVQRLKSAIDKYMDAYAEGQTELKTRVRILSVYLTFIAKKPLHPEGMFRDDGKAFYKNGKVVCPMRKQEVNKPGALCRFCVSVS